MLFVGFIFLLISCHNANGQVSCAELKQQGDLSDGMKNINPEEIAGVNVAVECDMTSDPNDGITVIHHDSETRTLVHDVSYQSPGSYVRTITYTGYTMEQIKQLVQKSASCEQYLEHECHHSFVNYFGDEPYTWWVSRDGINMYMWGGGKTYNRTCACGITGTCESSQGLCNCDKNDRQLRSDGGYLVDRDRLPVTKIHMGDSDAAYEYGFYSLGPLKCRGIAPPALRSCAEVKAAGFTQTDSYLLDPDGDGGESAFWAYCDLDVYDDEGLVVTVVFHDTPYRTYVHGYNDPKFQQVLTYPATDTQLRMLTGDSSYCQQYVNIDCYGIAFTGSVLWISINGNQILNWGGVASYYHACPCSLDGSCASASYYCNCDENISTWRDDKGYIFNKEELPMKEMLVGDTDDSYEELYFRVGPLECTGPMKSTITRGNSCYKVKTEAVTWQEAANSCRRMNAHLVTIDDDDERVYLTKLTQALVPLSSFWSDAECSPVAAGLSFSCDALIGYVCESELSEYSSFKKVGSDKSPLGSSLLSSKTAISSGACSLHCEGSSSCNSFSYNSKTHECKASSESTDSNAVPEDGFDLFILQTTYQECPMHLG